MSEDVVPQLEMLIDVVRKHAKAELVSRFARIKQKIKQDGSILTEADMAMQRALHSTFETAWPAIPFLAEEMSADQQRQLLENPHNMLWVVDPLDGTSNFSVGIPFYSVSVALIQNGELQLALVYDPERDEAFYAQRGKGAYLNDQRICLADMSEVEKMTIGIVDYKRLSPALANKLVTQAPYKSQRSFGSVALDWCWIAAGRGDVYVHGKQNLWDYAAGQLILHEAGGLSSTLAGDPVFNCSLTPRSAALAINPKLHKDWLAFLRV